MLSLTADGVTLEVGVNPEFLLQAITAIGQDDDAQLVLGLDGPISPLVLSDAARPEAMSLLMPIRLTVEQPTG